MHLDGWTLALQALNLLVLLALLRWLFYRPLLAVIDARRKAVEDEQAAAQAARSEAEARLSALQAEQQGAAAERERLLQSARAAIASERSAAAASADQAAAAAQAEAGRRIERERLEARGALFDEAAALATALAQRLLVSTPLGGVAGCVQALITRAAATPAEERARWFSAEGKPRLTLASAPALDEAAERDATARLREVFGNQIELRFVADPTLIAGAELRFDHGLLGQHWAAELAAARALLTDAPVEPGR